MENQEWAFLALLFSPGWPAIAASSTGSPSSSGLSSFIGSVTSVPGSSGKGNKSPLLFLLTALDAREKILMVLYDGFASINIFSVLFALMKVTTWRLPFRNDRNKMAFGSSLCRSRSGVGS